MKRTPAAGTFLVILLILTGGAFLASVLIGPARTSPGDLWSLVAHGDPTHAAIFLDLRLSRAVLAFLVGASLALSGAILQGYFRNPMADPFVVGVSSGASLGAVLAVTLGLQTVLLGFPLQALMAFASGLGIVSVVYLLSQRGGMFKVETLLLTGIAAGALASSLTSFFLFLRADSFDQAVFWLLGSFQLAGWPEVRVVGPYFLAGLAVAIWLAKDMNLLVLGDETAQALGCPTGRVRKILLTVATFLAALSVSVSGIIGFVGLVVPHWVRLLIGPDHRRLFPFSALAGGTFLVYSDLLARTLLPAELPIGVITAAVGAPVFLYLLHRKR